MLFIISKFEFNLTKKRIQKWKIIILIKKELG